MYFYQILPNRRLPSYFLTYKSQNQVRVGQCVKINIQNKITEGLVIKELSELEISKQNFKITKIKEISEIIPVKFSEENLNFLKLFTQNTLNTPNSILESMLQPFKLLTKKHWQELEIYFNEAQNQNIEKNPLNIDEIKDLLEVENNNFDIKHQNEANLSKNDDLVAINEFEQKTTNFSSQNEKLDLNKKNNNDIQNISINKDAKNSINLRQKLDLNQQNENLKPELISNSKSENDSQKMKNEKKLQPKKIDFLLDKNYLLRIRYIIRTNILGLKKTFFLKSHNKNLKSNNSQKSFSDDFQSSSNKNSDSENLNLNQAKTNSKNKNLVFLIIFPEQKMLDKNYSEFTQEIISKLENTPEFQYSKINWQIFNYSGSPVQNSKNTVRNLLTDNFENEDFDFSIKIYLSTRSGIFLPFKSLDTIILIDEANSMHIQEQNKIYFDTRDAVFLLASSWSCELFYLSSLPSVRLQTFYNTDIINQFLAYEIDKKPLANIKIIERTKESQNNNLFSYEIEEILEEIEEL